MVSVAIHGVTARSNPAFSRIEEKNAFFDINKAYLEPAKSVISLIAINQKEYKTLRECITTFISDSEMDHSSISCWVSRKKLTEKKGYIDTAKLCRESEVLIFPFAGVLLTCSAVDMSARNNSTMSL